MGLPSKVPLPEKGAAQKKLLGPQNENSIKRPIKSRGVLTPIGNVRKSHLISVKTGKTNNKFSLPATTSEALNSLPQTLALKRKSNRGCVTFFDHQRRMSQLYPISRIVPQKKLPLNLHQQQRNLSRWETWTAECPNWIVKNALIGSKEAKLSKSGKTVDKENRHFENENTNCSYVTVEEEYLEISNNETFESDYDVNDDNLDKENRKWRDWSIQLSDDGKLLITGKTDDNVHQAKDVTSCERVDSNTLKFRNGVVYELVGMPDHFTNLPCHIRNKFQCGFPSDWKETRELWIKYVNEGSPFDFNWSAITGKYYSNLLDQLDVKNCEKGPGLKKKKNHLSPGKQKCVGNGKTPGFESQNQEIVLCNWTPVLVKEGDIKIKGSISGSPQSEIPHVTDVIKARLSSDSFRCVNGTSYKLDGSFVDPENSIPDEIKKKLAKGLPPQWKLMVKKWHTEIRKTEKA